MKKRRNHTNIIHAMCLFWLCICLTGMHAHQCFDGEEPPYSAHFGFVYGLPDEVPDPPGHVDIDLDSDNTVLQLIKIFSFDLPFFIATFLLAITWLVIRVRSYAHAPLLLYWPALARLRPPLRAPPPSYSC